MKKLLVFLLPLLPILLFSQKKHQPASFFYKGRTFLIYPVRASNLKEVPPTGFSLPDGPYIIFDEYTFKPKRLRKTMVMKDSLTVAGLINIKNNLPEGPAEFYSYDSKTKRSIHAKWETRHEGNYVNGLKNGLWKKWTGNVLKETATYKDGILNGPQTEYFENGLPMSRYKRLNGQRVDTFFLWYSNGQLRCTGDYLNEETDTLRPEKNLMDFVYKEHSLRTRTDRSNEAKTFYKEYSRDGKLNNHIRFNMGRNPVFDTIKSSFEKFYVTFKNDSVYTVTEEHVQVLRTKKGKFLDYGTYSTERFKSKQLITKKILLYHGKYNVSKLVLETDENGRFHDTTSNFYADLDKIDPKSWKDTIISTERHRSGQKWYYHSIPALGFCWYSFGTSMNYHKPLDLDTINKRVLFLDTLGDFQHDVHIARELWAKKDRSDETKGSLEKTKEKLRFMEGVNNCSAYVYFSTYVSHGRINHFGEMSQAFKGWAHSSIWLENKKPMNGKFVFVKDKEQKKKSKFTSPVKISPESATTLETGYLVEGVRNGRWERLKLNRKKNITDNFELSYRKDPKNGEYYIAADFKDGEIEGIMRSWQTDVRQTYEKGKFKMKTYVYMDYEANYTEGYLNGPYKTYHYNGATKFTAHMNMGRFDGPVERFNSDGKLLESFTMKNDTLHGSYKEFYEGKKTVEAFFENNLLQGHYVLYSRKDSKTLLEVVAEKNVLRSKKLYFTNGELMEEIICADSSKTEFGRGAISVTPYLEMLSGRSYLEGKNKLFGQLKTFYENGKLHCEGRLEKGQPAGKWKFYNIAGQLINEVVFCDTTFYFPGKKDSLRLKGSLTGYFNNGKLRCKGFVQDWSSSYDCSSHQDKTWFELVYTDTWTYDGAQLIKDGNGSGMIYDENGLKTQEGKIEAYTKSGTWKLYDPNQKLHETGKYENGKKEGLWYEGDLENLNFEDAACFDPNNTFAMKQLEYSKNKLSFYTKLYKNGKEIHSQHFNSNLNKTRDYSDYRFRKRRRNVIVDF